MIRLVVEQFAYLAPAPSAAFLELRALLEVFL